jgi:hypothetical protein
MLQSKTMIQYCMFKSEAYKNFTMVRGSTRFEGKSLQEIDEIESNNLVAYQVKDAFPIGNQAAPKQQNDTFCTYQNGGEEWALFRPFYSDGSSFGFYGALVAGDFCLIKPQYFKVVTEYLCGDGDYCGYCGTFNGSNGESRVGYDCCLCGGN